MSDPVIAVHNVSKRFRVPLDHSAFLHHRLTHPVRSSRYRELTALDDASFDISQGEFVGIAGPNGSGKSTLLRMIAGVYAPDTGTVQVRGRVSPFIDLGVGFKPELTARENVLLAGAVLGLTRSQVATRLDDVMDFAELADFADQKLKRFSSGMTSRLAFSVAMMADADILLLDEVLAVGDARFREKCLSVFAHYKRENKTLVLVSHDLGTMESYCDRILLMQEGRLIADGVPADVAAEYRVLVSKMSELPQKKASSRTETPHFVGAPGTKRWGSKEVEITDIRVLDVNGKPHRSFLTSEALTVEIDYVSHDLDGQFQCAVGFGRDQISLLAAPQTKFASAVTLAVVPGSRGTIAYRIPSLNFLSASYMVSVSFFDEHMSHFYDAIKNALEFRVTDERGRLGWVELDGEWTHRSEVSVAADAGAVA